MTVLKIHLSNLMYGGKTNTKQLYKLARTIQKLCLKFV